MIASARHLASPHHLSVEQPEAFHFYDALLTMPRVRVLLSVCPDVMVIMGGGGADSPLATELSEGCSPQMPEGLHNEDDKQAMSSARSLKLTALKDILAQKLVGQPEALQQIIPYIQTHQSGLAPRGRPLGVFLLLGPTGTGKTRTIEVLAEVLHGSPQHFLSINCGEFQLDHEVARLIGAPPGYIGHRETTPLLSVQRLTAATSPGLRYLPGAF